jgi:hypothetical protein
VPEVVPAQRRVAAAEVPITTSPETAIAVTPEPELDE